MTGERITAAAYRAQQAFAQDLADFERIGGLFFSRTAVNKRRLVQWQTYARENPGKVKIIFLRKTVHIRPFTADGLEP